MEGEKVRTLYRSNRSRSNTPLVGEQDSQQGVISSKRTISSNVKVRRRSGRHKSNVVPVVESQQGVIANNKIQDSDSDSSLDLDDNVGHRYNRQELHRVKRRLEVELNGSSVVHNESNSRSVKQRGSGQKQDQQKTSDYSSEEFEPGLAYQLYKKAGDWWNTFPKTDYTYSPASEYRKEVAPGVYPMPNMSRRPLHSTHIKTTPELKKSMHIKSTPELKKSMHIKTSPELKKTSVYTTSKSTVHHVNESRFRDSGTLGMHTNSTKRVEYDWDALDSDVDEIAQLHTSASTSKKTESWRFTSTVISVFTYIWNFISIKCTSALSYISRTLSQTDDVLLQGTPEREMPSSANWLERLMTWFYITLCSIMTLDVWILSRIHGMQTESHQMSSRNEQVGHFYGEELDENLVGKKRKYWRLVLLLLPILFVFGLLGFYQPIGFPEMDKIAAPETWPGTFMLPFSVASTLLENIWYAVTMASEGFVSMIVGAVTGLWSALTYCLWFPIEALMAWKDQPAVSKLPDVSIPLSAGMQKEVNLDDLARKVLSSEMLKKLIAEQMAHHTKVEDGHQKLLLQVSSELQKMQEKFNQLSSTTDLEKNNVVKMQEEMNNMQQQIRQFQDSLTEKVLLMQRDTSSQQQEINTNSFAKQMLHNLEFQQMLTAQVQRESNRILEIAEDNSMKNEKLVHDHKTVIQQFSEDLHLVLKKLEQLSANMENVQERERERDGTLHQVQQQILRLQAQHIRQAQLYKSCCKTPGSFVLPQAIIEQKVTEAFMDILKNSTGKHFLHPTDFGVWMKSVLVAHDELDAKLANLTSTLKLHTRDVVQRTKEMILLTVSDRIQEEIAKQQKQSLFNATPNMSKQVEGSATLSDLQVRTIVDEALSKYDADKTGLVDYALESSGGSVVSIRCTETYQAKTALMAFFGIPIWYQSNSPRTAIQPNMHPGECWAFRGSQGYLVIKLSKFIHITAFSMEHIPRSLDPTGRIDSAPKDFRVLALKEEQDESPKLLGRYTYQQNGTSLQYFILQHVLDEPYDMVELDIESNHGNLEYTCLYRFRVHGTLSIQ